MMITCSDALPFSTGKDLKNVMHFGTFWGHILAVNTLRLKGSGCCWRGQERPGDEYPWGREWTWLGVKLLRGNGVLLFSCFLLFPILSYC